jgi:hypothetical protein
MGRWEELHRRNSLSNFENRNCPLDVVQVLGVGSVSLAAIEGDYQKAIRNLEI